MNSLYRIGSFVLLALALAFLSAVVFGCRGSHTIDGVKITHNAELFAPSVTVVQVDGKTYVASSNSFLMQVAPAGTIALGEYGAAGRYRPDRTSVGASASNEARSGSTSDNHNANYSNPEARVQIEERSRQTRRRLCDE